MIRDLMKRCALLGVTALLAAACLGDKDMGTKVTSQLLVRFEPDMESGWGEFLHDFFNDGQDTVSVKENFSIGPVYHFAKLDESGGFLGGMVMARGHDAFAAADRKPSRLAVYDKGYGDEGSKVYAVFHDTTAALMPDHAIRVYIPNAESVCSPVGMSIHNVQAAAQAARYGVGLAGGPFRDDDYLTLTVVGVKGSAVTGQVEVKLIDGTRIVDEWKDVSLENLGKIDAIDMHLASSRADFPLYCCLDNMSYTYIEVY